MCSCTAAHIVRYWQKQRENFAFCQYCATLWTVHYKYKMWERIDRVHQRPETGWVSRDSWKKNKCRTFVHEAANSLLSSQQTLFRSDIWLMYLPRRNDWQLLDGAERSESYVNLASYDKVPVARQMNDSIWYTYPDNWLSHKVSPSQYSGGLIWKEREALFHLGFDLSSLAHFLSCRTSASKCICEGLIVVWHGRSTSGLQVSSWEKGR